MPKSETSNSNGGPSFQAPRYRPNWLAAVICFVLGPSLTVALIDYTPQQVTLNSTHATATNIVGTVGANSVWCSLYVVGFATWLIPVFLFWMLYVAIRNPRRLSGPRLIAMLVAVLTLAGLAAMFTSFGPSTYFPRGAGGLVGFLLYDRLLEGAIGPFGSGLLLATTYTCALVFVLTRDVGAELERHLAAFHAWRDARARRKAELKEAREKARLEKAKAKGKPAPAPVPLAQTNPPIGPAAKKIILPKTAEDPLAKPAGFALEPPAAKPDARAPALKLDSKARSSESASAEPVAPKVIRGAAKAETTLEKSAAGVGPVAIVKAEETRKAKAPSLPAAEADYLFPPIKLLKELGSAAAENSDEEYTRNMADLVRILGEFGVAVNPGEIHVGPVITCYEVVPAPGVRVEKIAGLDKNIALGMRAQSVRILAPIPGKAAVGVEMPNRVSSPVGLRDILESEDWSSARAEIPIALGKDVSGKPLISDLTRMPHLLIAGATGSGKSVCINSIIASIVFRKSPKDVRLIMVDPKVVELKIFNTLPHMLIPVVTEAKKVPGALKWLLAEMEQRYQQFAKVGVRNIAGFNSRKKNSAPELPPAAEIQPTLDGISPALDDIEIPERLPYIVAIIDELADLMMVAPAEIETSIARLAQLARAAGIHLIIATQRPSVNVITGVIKANLPSRIAFQVASQVDSRTILDVKGADTLIGRGDMLFSPPGSSRLVRAQGAFVSDEEVQEFVEHLKKNGPPQYVQSVQQHIDRAASAGDEDGGDGDDDDLGDDGDLYNQALDVLKSSKRASTSMLQRRLRIGYNRAARIMEIMEEKGIVGPENGSSPREILVDLDSL
jgi:S-DNA-T family DNA segregation ATPase FtsK/SpoIIIE